jgi:hypothetical protein
MLASERPQNHTLDLTATAIGGKKEQVGMLLFGYYILSNTFFKITSFVITTYV